MVKFPDRRSWRKRWFVLVHRLRHHTKALAAVAWSSWLHSYSSLEAKSNRYLCLAHCLLFMQSRILAQGLAPPTVGRSSHISYPNQDNPPQEWSEAHLSDESRFHQVVIITTVDLFSHKQLWNDVIDRGNRWKLETVILSKVSQTPDANTVFFFLIFGI